MSRIASLKSQDEKPWASLQRWNNFIKKETTSSCRYQFFFEMFFPMISSRSEKKIGTKNPPKQWRYTAVTGLWRRGLWIEQLPSCHIQDVKITAPWALTNIGKGKGRMLAV